MQSNQTMNLRPEVRAFAEAMELKLRQNAHKGGWQSLANEKLANLLVGEVVELLASIQLKPNDILSMFVAANSKITWDDYQSDPCNEAGDVANVAMMFFDNLNRRKDSNGIV